MLGRKNLEASLEGLEIGATGPGRLQLVVRAGRNKVAVKFNAAEARWLASALEQWADRSETIPPVRPVSSRQFSTAARIDPLLTFARRSRNRGG